MTRVVQGLVEKTLEHVGRQALFLHLTKAHRDDDNRAAVPCVLVPTGSGDSSLVIAPDSSLKGRGFKSLQERREIFFLSSVSFLC